MQAISNHRQIGVGLKPFTGAAMISKKELLADNEQLIALLFDVLCFAEEEGLEIPDDLRERVGEWLIITDDGYVEEDEDVIDIKPAS
jgi:hypothetical protein